MMGKIRYRLPWIISMTDKASTAKDSRVCGTNPVNSAHTRISARKTEDQEILPRSIFLRTGDH